MKFKLVEYLVPILEDTEQYRIRYWNEGNKWVITVYNSSDEELETVTCDNILDRDVELNYLQNDYNTKDCQEVQE